MVLYHKTNSVATKYKGIPSYFNRNIKTRQVCLTFHFYLRPSHIQSTIRLSRDGSPALHTTVWGLLPHLNEEVIQPCMQSRSI